MLKASTIVAVATAAMLGTFALAQSDASVSGPKIGTDYASAMFGARVEYPVVTAVLSAPVRSAPPSGVLGQPGAVLYETDEQQQYAVTGSNEVQHLFSKDVWVKVAPVDEAGNIQLEKSGWAYWGPVARPSSNFLRVEEDVQAE